jgi:serine phosphatase RsbU (regulator of sigma subunit)
MQCNRQSKIVNRQSLLLFSLAKSNENAGLFVYTAWFNAVYSRWIMKQFEIKLDREIRMGVAHLAQSLIPEAGAIPRIPNVDVHATNIPVNRIAGGDLVTFVNFKDRYDLDARIAHALSEGREDIAQSIQRLKRKGGILVADVAGHEFTDAIRALLLHQAFYLGTLYELDLYGEITTHLIEQINMRFYKSETLHRLAGDSDSTSFVTLIYGEISNSGRFRFVSAGHPPPLVFSREYDRFVEISPDRMISFPPIGLQLSEENADAKLYQPVLGYRKRYTVNELNLMGQGDVLLLYTDGLVDPFSDYTQQLLERAVSRSKDGTAREICDTIIEDRNSTAEQTDDLSLVVIKYR